MSWLFCTPEGLAFFVVGLSLWYEYLTKKKWRVSQFLKKHPKIGVALLFGALFLNALAGYINHGESERQKNAESQFRAEFVKRDEAFKKEAFEKDAAHRIAIESQSAEFSRLQSIANTDLNTCKLALMIIATNQYSNVSVSYTLSDLKSKYRIAESSVMDLKTWTEELNNQRELTALKKKQVENERIINCVNGFKPSYVVWDYAFDKYTTLFRQMIQKSALNCDLTPVELPTIETLAQKISRGGSEDILYCDFQIGDWVIADRKDWKCSMKIKCNIIKNQLYVFYTINKSDRLGPPRLIIECKSNAGTSKLTISASESWLLLPNIDLIQNNMTTNDFRQSIDNNIRLFITQQAVSLGLVK